MTIYIYIYSTTDVAKAKRLMKVFYNCVLFITVNLFIEILINLIFQLQRIHNKKRFDKTFRFR